MSTPGELSGKTAVITGGGSGIGRDCALVFAQNGAKVAVADLSIEAAEETARLIGESGAPLASILQLDVSSEVDVREILGGFLARDSVDVLVNSAGIGVTRPFLETEVALLDKVHAVNLRGTFLCAQEAARAMVRQGTGGAIVNIGSASGARGNAGRAAYGSAKAAVANLTQVMAVELASHGIRVNCVAPGPIETPLVAGAHSAQTRRAWFDELPIARYGQVREVAEAVLFLASDRASYINGHVLYVDGGFHGAGVMRAG
jgi:NAD(P)-dependent dehydrogenase (short-subunit alcohol dehydrogenase family)